MKYDLYNYKASVIKVYDGDTITVDVDLGFNMIMRKQKVRLLGIDTPEVRGEEREAGLVSRDRLRELILGKEIVMRTYRDKSGKYGRWLATVYVSQYQPPLTPTWVNVNKILVTEGLAKIYG